MKNAEENIKSLLIRFFDGLADSSEKDVILNWLHESKENVDYGVSCYKEWAKNQVRNYDLDKDEGWREFISVIRPYHHFVAHRTIYYSIAAVAVLLLGVFCYLKFQGSQELDIVKFASLSGKAVNMHSSDVKLVLSSDSALTFNSKNANIQYKSNQIVCNNGQSISGEAVASYNQLIVPYGHSSNLMLSDGTRIWLNSGTRLVYPSSFRDKNREIYVEGEIYLEVAHDAQHPFVVRTYRNMNVQVLGTHFDVRAYKSESVQRVVLISGSVQVKQNNMMAKLQPRDMYEMVNGRASVREVDPSCYISWVNDLFVVDNQRLGEILKILKEYYGVDINFDSSVAVLKCSGKIDLRNNIENVLKSISVTAPITFTHNNNKYYIHLK